MLQIQGPAWRPAWDYLGHWFATPGRKIRYHSGGLCKRDFVCTYCPLGAGRRHNEVRETGFIHDGHFVPRVKLK